MKHHLEAWKLRPALQPPLLEQITADFSHLITELRTGPRSELKPAGQSGRGWIVKGFVGSQQLKRPWEIDRSREDL